MVARKKPTSKGKKVRAGARAGGPKRAPRVARPRRPPVRPKRRSTKARPVEENPEALGLAHAIANVAMSKKGRDVTIIDMREKGAAVGYDYIVLASGDSGRQLEAMQDALDEKLRLAGQRARGVQASADWVLVHFDDVVAHFFTPDKRHLIDLEGLWSDAPRVEVSA